MKTVGEVLRAARLRQDLTYSQLESRTRIRQEYIAALESGEYQKLPPPTFVKGFISNLGKELDLNIPSLLALYRREFDEKEKNVPNLAPEPLNPPKFRITPGNALVGSVVIFLILFFGYLYKEYYALAGAPLLVVEEPVDQTQIKGPTITVSGRTYPDAKLTINGQTVIVSPDGTFKTEMKSSQALTTITFIAENKRGRQNTIVRTVRVLNPET